MKILLVSRTVIPVYAYGGTERVIWDLGLALFQQGHQVTYLVSPGSHCDFAKVIYIDPSLDLREQIPDDVDIVHFQFRPDFDLDIDFEKNIFSRNTEIQSTISSFHSIPFSYQVIMRSEINRVNSYTTA